MEEFLSEINEDIKNIFQFDIETSNTDSVPSRNDSGLTFPIGSIKKGKIINTCVLMIDIRDSTTMSKELKKEKVRLGKIYSAFIYAMTSIADKYGYVRNIIGDRVMVVFEPEDCFNSAIQCAAVMYTVATKFLKVHAKLSTFKIGIGIDYGELLVLKTGIVKRDHEQSEHKALVWVGDAANIASKLCDFANKSYSAPLFKVTYEKAEFYSFPSYKTEKVKRSESVNYVEFASNYQLIDNIQKYKGYPIDKLEIENRNKTTSPILMSGRVLLKFRELYKQSSFLKYLEVKDYPNSPSIASSIFGGVLLLPEANSIKP